MTGVRALPRKVKTIQMTMLLVAMFFGNMVLSSRHIFHMLPTLDLLLLPCLSVWVAYTELYGPYAKGMRLTRQEAWQKHRVILISLSFMALWILYALGLFATSPWLELRRAFVEIRSLLKGSLYLFNLYLLCQKDEDLHRLWQVVKMVGALLVLGGLLEITTGMHAPSSQLMDSDYYELYFFRFYYLASGRFYNINDYGMFLGMLFPLYYVKGQGGRGWRRGFEIFLAMGIVLILAFNDSRFALFGVLFVILLYPFLVSFNFQRLRETIGGIVGFVSLTYLAPVLQYFLDSNAFTSWHRFHLRVQGFFYGETWRAFYAPLLEKEWELAQLAKKSLHFWESAREESLAPMARSSIGLRLEIYGRSLMYSWERFGLGLGPGGLQSYMKSLGMKGQEVGGDAIIDPHSLYFEILAHYGIIFTAILSVFFLWLLYRALQGCLRERRHVALVWLLSFIGMGVASFGPAAALNFNFIWLPVGALLVLAKKTEDLDTKEAVA